MLKVITYIEENNNIKFEILMTDQDNTNKFITIILLDFKKDFTYQDYLSLEHRNDIEFMGIKETTTEDVFTAEDIKFQNV